MPASPTRQEFSRAEALRVLGVSERQLKGWEKVGLVEQTDRYAIPQLVALRTLARLKAAHVPSAKIRRAVEAVRRRLQGVRDPLAELRLYSEGNRVRVQVGRERMEPESGQLLLDFDESEFERMVSLESRRREEAREAAQRKQREAEQWFLKGVEIEQAGGPVDQALDAYRIAVTLDPKLAAAMVNLGTIYFSSGEFDKAARYYARAIEANAEYPLAHFNMGNLYDERGDRVKAMLHYQTAIKLDPNYADAHYNLAVVFQVLGETLKAVRHWRIYLKLDPASPWADVARRELAKLYAATVVQGDKEKSKSHADGV